MVKNCIKILTILVVISMVYKHYFKLSDEELDEFMNGKKDYISINLSGISLQGPNG